MTQRKLIQALGVKGINEPVTWMEITRRPCDKEDVFIQIHYCGICHSDYHQANGHWKQSKYPMVPGHEIVGIVQSVGENVKKFKVGDKVGVGCFIDSCRECKSCGKGEEQYCKQVVMTYNSIFHHDRKNDDYKKITFGGYSQSITVDQKYVLKIPESLLFSHVAPLLCAGISVYSPFIYFNLRANHRLAVAGLGGLGHMAVKLGKAFGAHVTVLSRGESKREDSFRLGADAYINVNDPLEIQSVHQSFDFLINTIANEHDISKYIDLTKNDSTICMLGMNDRIQFSPLQLVMGRRKLVGSLIGGIPEIEEMLLFCEKHNILSDCELIDPSPENIMIAWKRMDKGDVFYRFVIDFTKLYI